MIGVGVVDGRRILVHAFKRYWNESRIPRAIYKGCSHKRKSPLRTLKLNLPDIPIILPSLIFLTLLYLYALVPVISCFWCTSKLESESLPSS